MPCQTDDVWPGREIQSALGIQCGLRVPSSVPQSALPKECPLADASADIPQLEAGPTQLFWIERKGRSRGSRLLQEPPLVTVGNRMVDLGWRRERQCLEIGRPQTLNGCGVHATPPRLVRIESLLGGLVDK